VERQQQEVKPCLGQIVEIVAGATADKLRVDTVPEVRIGFPGTGRRAIPAK